MRSGRLLTIALVVTLFAGAGVARGTPTDVFFSEYIEGSSYNKALEIYNGTGAPVDLAGGNYVIQMYFNGSWIDRLTIAPGPTAVADGDVYGHRTRRLPIGDPRSGGPDRRTATNWFNGDDAVVLRKGGASGPIVDVIGEVGFDPGTEWGFGLESTQDNTLRRRGSIEAGIRQR